MKTEAELMRQQARELEGRGYFSGKQCQISPCLNDGTVLITDNHMGWMACEACADKMAAEGWQRVPAVQES